MIAFSQLRQDSLDEYLDGIPQLPSAPPLLIRLLELFRQTDADANEVVRTMRADAALAGEVLQRCNKLFFGNENKVREIEEAVFQLGFQEIYRVTVALCGLRAFVDVGEGAAFSVASLRLHACLTAIAAGAIAREVGESEGVAFTAGLLHDLGKVILAKAEGARYGELAQHCGHGGDQLSAAEKTIFGFSHGEVGARLMLRWGVPELISVPARFHHQREQAGFFKHLVAIVDLASSMAQHVENKTTNNLNDPLDARWAMDVLVLKPARILRLQQQLHRQWKQLPVLLAD